MFNDPTKASKIGSLIVGGLTDGTVAGGDSFGINAQEIGSVRIGGVNFPLDPGPADATDRLFIGSRNATVSAGLPFFNDFVVQEVL